MSRLLAVLRIARRFNVAAYRRENPDVAAAGVDPAAHFLDHGAAEGRAARFHSGRDCPEEIAASSLFDARWYLSRYPDVAAAGIDPFEHFLDHGLDEDRDPGPGFASSWYRRGYAGDDPRPPLLHYLREGKAAGFPPCVPPEALTIATRLVEDLRGVDAGFDADPALRDLAALPLETNVVFSPAWKAFVELFNTLNVAPDHLVCVGWFTRGGGDRIAAHILHAAAKLGSGSRCLMLITDIVEDRAIDWLPADLEIVNIPRRWPHLNFDQRAELIDHIIRHLRPRSVLTFHSRACWDAYRLYGERLAAHARLYAYVFNRDFDAQGRPFAFLDTHLPAVLPWMTRVYSDNEIVLDEFRSRIGAPASLASKFRVIAAPLRAPPARAPTPRPAGIALRVFWAGRFSPQKNVELLAAVSRAAPETMTFDVWGDGDARYETKLKALAQDNPRVRLHGVFADFFDLPLDDYDAYLFTSRFEGRPVILGEAASVGLPIVATRVGGVGELLDARCWLIEDQDDPAPYVAALTEIADDPQGAQARANSLRDDLLSRNSLANFEAAICAPGEFLEPSP